MMTKPHWCPQGLWDDTGMAFDQLYDTEPDLEGGCEQSIREYGARLALAAEQRERNGCIAALEMLVRKHGEPGAMAENPYVDLRKAQAAIRNRSQDQ